MINTLKAITVGLLVLSVTPSFAMDYVEVKPSPEQEAEFKTMIREANPPLNRAEAISITPMAGSFMLPSNRNLNSRPTLGLRTGYNITENVTAEAVVSYGLGRDRDARESNSVRYGMDILYHIQPAIFFDKMLLNKFVPFVAMGAGGNWLSTPSTPGLPSIASKNYATVNYGGGLKYFMTPDIALRGDLRHVVSFEESTRSNIEYTAGITFNFGGIRQAVAPVAVAACAEPKTITVEKIVEVPKYIDRVVEKPVTVYVEKKVAESAPVEVKTPQNVNTAVKSVVALAVESKLKVLTGQNFALNGVTLTASGKKALSQNASILKQYPSAKILVIGHASASGTDDHNQKLSEKRANTVRDLLIKAGINKKQITTIGYGSSKPAIVEVNPRDINSPAALANRRVVIEVSGI